MYISTSQFHYVYIVQCADGTLYTGYTNNVERRIATHNAGKGGHYTRAHRPVVLLASWVFLSKREALQREYQIKRLPRVRKLQLIEAAHVSDMANVSFAENVSFLLSHESQK